MAQAADYNNGQQQTPDYSNLIAAMLKTPRRAVLDNTKLGGYPVELFTDLPMEEKEKYACGICLLVAREPQQCDNGHVFCTSCIGAWSSHQSSCPVCRVKGVYRPSLAANDSLALRPVTCLEPDCPWTGSLAAFIPHLHASHPTRLAEMFVSPATSDQASTEGLNSDIDNDEFNIDTSTAMSQLDRNRRQYSMTSSTTSFTPLGRRSRSAERRRRRLEAMFEMCRGQLQRYQGDVERHFEFIRTRHRESQAEAEELERRLIVVSGEMMRLLSTAEHAL